jgi:hypothetical protein
MTGRKFEHVVTRDGRTFDNAVVTFVAEDQVQISFPKGQTTLTFAQCPEVWVKAFALDSGAPPVPAAGTAPEPGPEVDEAIVVIVGDLGSGTGFFVHNEGKTYLYTAAHVLSGNSKLQVKNREGKLITQFGAFEAAEGGDMVRLEVLDASVPALEIGSSSGASTVGMEIFACGNSGGGGTVGHERGTVLGVGPESIEIDARVIQGNSGGPVIDAKTHAALGVVTHLTAARTDQWAKETRYSTVRRFGCRLDRPWQWKKMPVDAFLQEGRLAKKITLTNELMGAALQPALWNSATFVQNRDDTLARDILSLSAWIEEQKNGGAKFSEADRNKRLTSILKGAMFRARGQTADLDYSGFAWFHRETLRQALEERKTLEKAYLENIDSLR